MVVSEKASNFVKLRNDRYEVGEFDVLLCNVSYAVFRGKSIDRGLPLISDADAVRWLKVFYGVDTDDELRRKTCDDWRACLPVTIALEDGTLPRTPPVRMEEDKN